ncbi:glycosyltransferase family 2 protein [Psychrobacter jeotgali]|uniref:glycosyltransferase family 2 protein n=1 Tax=Psychrobacter jeotgali TaxID=179010 RepID=UPI001919C86C|nr:glycosyltransferase family 2 protein [Psychrobacter jeotgali]
MIFSLLIVNYNTEYYIEKLLNSILTQSMAESDFEIIISNNVQNDKLDQMLAKNHFFERLNIRLVPLSQNIGFGRGTNAAAQQAQAEHLLIINPDIILTDNDYLQAMWQFIQAHPDYGVISSQVLDDDGHDGSAYSRFEFTETFGFENQICWFEGSLMFIQKSVFEDIGGFDDDFFMYSEDVDLCYRIKKQGLALIKNNSMSVYHKGGASEPYRDYGFYNRWYKSKLLFMHKHYDQEQFAKFIDDLSKKQRIKRLRYRTLGLASPHYRQKIVQPQAMLDIISDIKSSSAKCLYAN